MNWTSFFYNTHASAWLLMVAFFVLTLVLLKAHKETGYKVSHIVLRVLFVITVLSGIAMLIAYQFPITYIVKGVLALILIGLMEMILGRMRRGVATHGLWLSFVIVLPLVLLMGYRLIQF